MSSIETENEKEPLREVPNLGQVLVNIGEVLIDWNYSLTILPSIIFKNWSLPTSVLTRQETIERDIVVFEFTKIHESIDKVATAIDEAINDVESNSNTEPKASANETIQAVKNGESIQLDASELAVSKIFWRSHIWQDFELNSLDRDSKSNGRTKRQRRSFATERTGTRQQAC